MQLNICGVVRMTGKSAKGPYDMGKLLTLSAIRPMERENFKRAGNGFECVEADCAPDVVEQMASIRLPALCDVDGEPRQSGDKVTFYVTRVRVVTPAAPAVAK